MSTQMAAQPVDATDADFQQVVIEASHEVPILVDFWAPWCEPCKVIGPVLEKLEGEYGGRFKLVKVNMDDNPMLAQALMIQSIPAVKLIMGGSIKDEFMGASPEPEVRAFLDKNLGGAAPVSEDGPAAGLRLLAAGDRVGALGVFQASLAKNPSDPEALIGMGNLALHEGDLERARQSLEAIVDDELEKLPDKTLTQQFLPSLRAGIFLLDQLAAQNGAQAGEAGDQAAAGEELELRFVDACRKALDGGFEEALEVFLGIVRENRKFRDDGGRKAMLAVFDLLPAGSELAGSYRTQLSSILFS